MSVLLPREGHLSHSLSSGMHPEEIAASTETQSPDRENLLGDDLIAQREREIDDEITKDRARRELFDLWVADREKYFDRYLAMPAAGQKKEGYQDTREDYDRWERIWYSTLLQGALTDTATRGLPEWGYIFGLHQHDRARFNGYFQAMTPAEQTAFRLWIDDRLAFNKTPMSAALPDYIGKFATRFGAVQALGSSGNVLGYASAVGSLKYEGLYGPFETWQAAQRQPQEATQDQALIAKEVKHSLGLHTQHSSYLKLYRLYLTRFEEYDRRYEAMAPKDRESYDKWEEEHYQSVTAQAMAATKARGLPEWEAIRRKREGRNWDDYHALTKHEQHAFDHWVMVESAQKKWERLEDIPHALMARFEEIARLIDKYPDMPPRVTIEIDALNLEDRALFNLWLAKQQHTATAGSD